MAKRQQQRAAVVNTYHIDVIAEPGYCELTNRYVSEQLTEVVTVEAATLTEARNLVPVFMRMRPRGQTLHMFHNGVEI